MTVNTTTSTILFTGIVDGVPLTIPFDVENTAHLEVTYGADVVAAIGVDYTVTLAPPNYDTATVTPLTGFAANSGGTINVQRKVPLTQLLHIPVVAALASARLEQCFDYLTFITTWLRDQLVRSLSFPTTDPIGSGGTLPTAATRAGKVLGFTSAAPAGRPVAVSEVAALDPMPSIAERAGRIFGWNASGHPAALLPITAPASVLLDGIFADAYGTGTANDTTIWNQIISDAVSTGLYKIYACRPSTVLNLVVNQPVQIVGNRGTFQFIMHSSAGSSDVAVKITADGVRMQGVTVVAPISRWTAPGTAAKGNACVWLRGPTSVPIKNVVLEDVVLIGSGSGVRIDGSDSCTLLNVESKYNWGFGITLSGFPHIRLRIFNSRGIACGGYAIACGDIFGTPTDSRGFEDCEIRGAYALNCGKFGYFTSLGSKYGYDFATNSFRGLIFEGVARGCMNGAMEVKTAGNPPAAVHWIGHSDQHYKVVCTQDCDIGNTAIYIGGTTPTTPPGSIKRIVFDVAVDYVGPDTYGASVFYEVGTAVKNGGKVYLCGGTADGIGGVSGSVGAPTGTGTGASSYFDGALYWTYLNTNDAVPAAGFGGVRVDGCGTATTIIHFEELTVTGCGSVVLMLPGNNVNHTIYNLVLDGPFARNCTNGIVDGGNQFEGTTPAFITGLVINNPDIESTSPAIQLGSDTGPTTVDAKIIGGRLRGSNALYLTGGTVVLDIAGGTRFIGTTGPAAYLHPTLVNGQVAVFDASFQNLANGNAVWQSDAIAGSWTNYGSVTMLQPDNTQRAYLINSGGCTFTGPVNRGITSAAPGHAGSVGEVLTRFPPSTTVSFYDCTTAGGAGVAVWSPKGT